MLMFTIYAYLVTYWGLWGPFSDCSTSCGDGTITRTRECISQPKPDQCYGNKAETETCNQDPCQSKFCSTFIMSILKVRSQVTLSSQRLFSITI